MKLTAQLNIRRRQLVSELMSIYPIVEVSVNISYYQNSTLKAILPSLERCPEKFHTDDIALYLIGCYIPANIVNRASTTRISVELDHQYGIVQVESRMLSSGGGLTARSGLLPDTVISLIQ